MTTDSGVTNANNKALYCQLFAWTLVAVVTVIALKAWSDYYGWAFWPFNAYTIFPLFGLLAYSIMWTHYISGTTRAYLKLDKSVLSKYFKITSFIVLFLICLHPGLLVYQRFRDGYGLPPHSYESYVMPGLAWVTIMGSTCLFIFLAYEFRHVFGSRPWWKYMLIAVDVAMLGIFYHALRLGTQLHNGWFKYVWWFYGLTLIATLSYRYYHKYLIKKQPS